MVLLTFLPWLVCRCLVLLLAYVCIGIHEGIILRLRKMSLKMQVAGDNNYPNNMVPSITEVTDTGPVNTTTILYTFHALLCPKQKHTAHMYPGNPTSVQRSWLGRVSSIMVSMYM